MYCDKYMVGCVCVHQCCLLTVHVTCAVFGWVRQDAQMQPGILGVGACIVPVRVMVRTVPCSTGAVLQ
jgi:hypothetical protein